MTTAANIGVQAAARFRDVSNVVVSATQWLAYLNQAYNEINRSSPLLPWLQTSEQTVVVTPPSRSVTLPTDVWSVNWVYDVTDDYRMIPQEGAGDQWHQDKLRSETGQPVTYRLRANTLEVFPIPLTATTFAIEGIFCPAALQSTDQPIFGQQWDALLIDGMLAKAYLDDGNDKWFTIHDGRFKAGLQDLVNFYLTFRTETNVPIRDTFWS